MTATGTATADTPQHRANVLVGANVRRELKAERYSERLAATRLQWSAVYMNRRVRGEVPFSPADLFAVARLLRIPVERLLHGLEQMTLTGMAERPERDSNAQPTDYIAVPRPQNTGRPPGRRDRARPRGRS